MLLAVLSIACSGHAYVPNSQFIFNRLTAQHGKGTYVIEDEVSIHEGSETAVIRENWIVVDGGEMRVMAQGDGIRAFRILKKGRLFWVDDTGSERSSDLSPDAYMKALIMRTPVEEKRVFFTWGILPPDVFKEKKLPKEAKDIEVATEPFARLARVGGTIAVAYGKPSPVSGPPGPGVWIEQDQFVIRKMRTPDGAEIFLNDYGTFSRGLVFPKSQSVTFDNHTAQIRVLKITASELSADYKRQFDLAWLRGRSDVRSTWPPTALGPVIQEFYRRFR